MGQEAYLSTELWTLSIERGSGRPSGAWNLEVAHRFCKICRSLVKTQTLQILLHKVNFITDNVD